MYNYNMDHVGGGKGFGFGGGKDFAIVPRRKEKKLGKGRGKRNLRVE